MNRLLTQEEIYRHALDEGVRNKLPRNKLYLKEFYSEKFSRFPEETRLNLLYWANHKADRTLAMPFRIGYAAIVIAMLFALLLGANLWSIAGFALLAGINVIVPNTGWFKATARKLAYYELFRFLEVVPPPGEEVELTEFGQS